MKKIYFLIITLIFFSSFCYAFDLDMTVDDDIRKQYNSGKLQDDLNIQEELPDLPIRLKKEGLNSLQSANINHIQENNVIRTGSIPVSKGTVFNVVNSAKISDSQREGMTVKFVTKSPILKRNYTIPAGAVFTGEIIESHPPQLTCNGGLVVIRLSSLKYNGVSYPINAYVTRADGKNIFLNNIKGERTYLKTVWKKGNWGRTIFNRMLTLTINLGGDGSTVLLSPFPFAYGTICLGTNAITSPICALFSKGGHVSISAGSSFKIKLSETAYIN